MKKILFGLLVVAGLLAGQLAQAAADLEINTPAIAALQNSMQARHGKLSGFYTSGAIGLTKEGLIAVKDASAVALKDRQSLNSLVSAENSDRNALYKEIAAANAHPEWEAEIRSTFAQRWVQKAQAGWWYQDASGWVKR
ncbi:MAG TPA: YdbL family protein [Methylotenera sp.]|nr:YdbL family protein [Methylotenera sp.]HSI25741.1 YdbL family protein [Methylotenera sp.]